MTEKIGLVKNPLTIIAIFAGIAEVSGTIVLPFIADANQAVFVWFLMVFPSLLVVLFFLTLNFNSKALYAPSDYQNEENYLQVHRYDKATKEDVGVRISVNDQIQSLADRQERAMALISEIKSNQRIHKIESEKEDAVEIDDLEQPSQFNLSDLSFLVSDVFDRRRNNRFINFMHKYGYNFQVYTPLHDSREIPISADESGAIWLGVKVPFVVAKRIVVVAKEYYPVLRYIHIDGDFKDGGEEFFFEAKQVFIGGATATALQYGLSPLSDEDFRRLANAGSESEFYSIIRSKKSY